MTAAISGPGDRSRWLAGAAVIVLFAGLWLPFGQSGYLIRNWMFIGLSAAPIIVFMAAIGQEGRAKDDATWPAVWLLTAYFVHQFEEHGIDALGRSYAFYSDSNALLNRVLGQVLVHHAPMTPEAIYIINTALVWLVGLVAVATARYRAFPTLALCGITLVNAATHLAAGLATLSYNPGLVTAILLFVPLSLYVYRRFLKAGARRIEVVASVIWAVLAHLLLVGGVVVANGLGLVPEPVYLAAIILWSLVPLAAFAQPALSLRPTGPD